jgi:hypothetical protein
MTPEELAEWIELGLRLHAAGPEKHDQVVTSLRRVVDAQEVIAEFDWQLAFRPGRPGKRYEA